MEVKRWHVRYTQENNKVLVTEDNMVIYDVYLQNIPKWVTGDNLKEHFSKYCGEISSITRMRYNKVYIIFKRPESVFLAIQESKLSGVLVKPAANWRQPKEPTIKIVDKIENVEDQVEGTRILDLNDDCLLHIFSYLSIYEQVTSARVCLRFQVISELALLWKKKFDDTIKLLTLLELRQVLQKIGPLIKEIQFREGKEMPKHVFLVMQSCPNIQSFELWDSNQFTYLKYRCCNIFDDLLKFINLKVLKFINCAVTDNACLTLSNLQMIEILDLSFSYPFTGKYLSKFKNLKQLRLAGNRYILPEHFIDLCKELNLEELDISGCSGLNIETSFVLHTYLNDLKKLAIAPSIRFFDWKSICKLKSLKSIKLYEYGEPGEDECFEELAKKQPQNLEELELYLCLNNVRKQSIYKMTKLKKLVIIEHSSSSFEIDNIFLWNIAKFLQIKKLILNNCQGISSIGLLTLFQISASIEYLDISGCKQINNDTIIDIIEKISKRKSLPCKLVVGGTSVTENLLKDKRYIDAKKFISVTFECLLEYENDKRNTKMIQDFHSAFFSSL